MRRLCLLLLVLVWGSALAEPKTGEPWRYPLKLEYQQVEVRIINWELTRGGKHLLLHAQLRSLAREPVRFPWRDFVSVVTVKDDSYAPNYDALVDRNGAGLTRTVGDFLLARGEKARITIPFFLGPEELPVKLRLFDGRISPPIK